MTKTILITGSTDGIGLEAAKAFTALGHEVLLHGRSAQKLKAAQTEIASANASKSYLADLSDLNEVQALSDDIQSDFEKIDVLINNAGVLKAPKPKLDNGIDIRFMVNSVAPYMLTKALMPILPDEGRVVNLSSAAQALVDIDAFMGAGTLDDMSAYAQSKTAITSWTHYLSSRVAPLCVSVNPGSLLATKMVKEGFGMAGSDIGIGSDILVRAALSDEFEGHDGDYFDNDEGQFAQPLHGTFDPQRSHDIIKTIENIIAQNL